MEQTSAVELTRRELIPLFCKLSALGCVFTDSVGLEKKKMQVSLYRPLSLDTSSHDISHIAWHNISGRIQRP